MSMGGRGVPSKLFVGGVSAHTTTEALRGHFCKYGRIVDAVVMQKNGRPRGFGFVTFDHPLAADYALAEQQWLDGRLVDVKRAVPGERAQERASNKIFVGGLPQDVGTDELRAYFSSYGAVADSVVMVDRRTNRSRGFGFVRFGNGVQGNAASEAVLNDFGCHRLAGKWVEVKRATPASQLQDMFPGAGLEEEMEMCGMTADEIMAAAAMGMPLEFMGIQGMSGWDASPCDDSTPMSMASLAMSADGSGSTRSHARGRRARRRKQREQKPGSEDLEDVSDDEDTTATTGSFSMSGTPLAEVAFVSTSNVASGNTSPIGCASFEPSFSAFAGAIAWDAQCEARALGSVATDARALGAIATHGHIHVAGSGGQGSGGQRHRSLRAVCGNGNSSHKNAAGASENDPSRANSISMPMNEPMKVGACKNDEGAFTREDFLSLEVGTSRAWGPAAW